MADEEDMKRCCAFALRRRKAAGGKGQGCLMVLSKWARLFGVRGRKARRAKRSSAAQKSIELKRKCRRQQPRGGSQAYLRAASSTTVASEANPKTRRKSSAYDHLLAPLHRHHHHDPAHGSHCSHDTAPLRLASTGSLARSLSFIEASRGARSCQVLLRLREGHH